MRETLKQFFRDTFLYRYVWLYRVRALHYSWSQQDERMLQFYSQFIIPGDLCFDIGANIGNRSRVLLKLNGRVVAVEPQPQCVKVMQKFLGNNPNFNVEPTAVGAFVGRADMMVSSSTVVSSLSKQWVQAVRESGRFRGVSWNNSMNVPVNTLDNLIVKYGIPKFIKIDVEGYEHEVIKGLSSQVGVISIEFTPEIIESSFLAIEHLQSIGPIELNYSVGESMQLASDVWMDYDDIRTRLSDFEGTKAFGDIYIRFM